MIHDGALLDYGKLVSNERFEEEAQYLLEFSQKRAAFVLDEVRRARQ